MLRSSCSPGGPARAAGNAARPDILEAVWGIDYNMGTNVVDVYVNYLRKKLDAAGGQKLIHTVIGMGYVLKTEHESPA